MRLSLLIGIVLVVIGGYLFVRDGSFSMRREVLEVGDVKVTAPEQHAVPNWLPPLAVIGGFGLIIFGGIRKQD